MLLKLVLIVQMCSTIHGYKDPGECSRYANKGKDDLTEICGRRGVQDTVSERIINGTEAIPGSWPWMVGLYTAENQFTCGGVLISREFVLTAAHCYWDKTNTDFLSVRLGSTKKNNHTVHCQRNTGKNFHLGTSDATVVHEDLKDKVVCIEVDYVCVPLQDNCTLFMKDLALLKLKEPVNFTTYIRPICLPEHYEEPPPNASIYGVGWGRVYDDYYEMDESLHETNEDAEDFVDYKTSAEETNDVSSAELERFVVHFNPETLMERNISLITNEQCVRQLATTVPNYILCSNGGVCLGDSGGPLMYEKDGQWFLAAINAVTDECYNPPGPSLHVRVSHLVDTFILPLMQQYQNSESTKHHLCMKDEARKECVTTFFNSYNVTLADSVVDDETSALKR
ncbi:enteropeptidase-like [Ixodes scapularis]|uniref:enteropeptidase-like n=1 Tax=Ixodes scapularis TaxID=6945 RepID=UPI001A9FCD40|nr:enteropeptidase-like [Ixodes scapularis]